MGLGERRGRRGRQRRRRGNGRVFGFNLLCCFGAKPKPTVQPMSTEDVAAFRQLQQQLQQGNMGTMDENTRALLVLLQQHQQQVLLQTNGQHPVQLDAQQMDAVMAQQRQTLDQIKQMQGRGTTHTVYTGGSGSGTDYSQPATYTQHYGGQGTSAQTFTSGTTYSQPFTGTENNTTFASGTVYSQPFSQENWGAAGSENK